MFEEIDFSFFSCLKENVSLLRDFCIDRDVLDLRSTCENNSLKTV